MHFMLRSSFREILLLLVTCLALSVVPVCLHAQECTVPIGDPLILSCYVAADTPLFKRISRWYEMVFCRAGSAVLLKSFPIARDAAEVGDGRIDGTFFRIAEFGRLYPNLVRVDEPLFEAGFCAYAKDEGLKGGVSLESLQNWTGKGLAIGYTRGIMATELLLAKTGLKKRHRLFAMTDHFQCLRMLQEGRVDLVIGTSQLVEDVLERKKMWSSGIYRAALLDSRVGYIYLNAKHIDLAPRLEEAIRQSKFDGSFERMLGIRPAY